MLPTGQWLPLQSLLSALETIKIGFGSNLTLMDHVSIAFYCEPVRLCARHQAYVTDIVAVTAEI